MMSAPPKHETKVLTCGEFAELLQPGGWEGFLRLAEDKTVDSSGIHACVTEIRNKPSGAEAVVERDVSEKSAREYAARFRKWWKASKAKSLDSDGTSVDLIHERIGGPAEQKRRFSFVRHLSPAPDDDQQAPALPPRIDDRLLLPVPNVAPLLNKGSYNGSLVLVLLHFLTEQSRLDRDRQVSRQDFIDRLFAELKEHCIDPQVCLTDDDDFIFYFLPGSHRTIAEILLQALKIVSQTTSDSTRPEVTGARIVCDVIDRVHVNDLPLHSSSATHYGWSAERKRVIQIARWDFECAPDVSVTHESPCILLTGSARRRIHHHVSCESIGQLRRPHSDAHSDTGHIGIVDSISQLWYLDDQASSVWTFDENKECHTIRAANDIEGQRRARQILKTLEQREFDSNHRVLHWECHPLRQSDLLAPVVASLRELMDLNRRPGVPNAVGDWLKVHADTLRSDEIARIKYIILGTKSDSDFTDVLADVQRLFEMLDFRIQIVVENSQHADTQTKQLVASLRSRNMDRRQIIEIEAPIDQALSGADDISPRSTKVAETTAQLDEHEIAMAKMCALLGWRVLRFWLKKLWSRREADRASSCEELPQFAQVLQGLLSKGILTYSGCLPNSKDSTIQHRDLSFRSFELHHEFRKDALADDELRTGIYAWFLEELRDFLSVGDNTVGGVRAKIRVCALLEEMKTDVANSSNPTKFSAKLGNLFEELRESLAKLWRLVGKRAYNANAESEAVHRLIKAADTIAPCVDSPVTAVANSALNTAASIYPILLACKDGDTHFARAKEVFARISGQVSTEHTADGFALGRAIWSVYQGKYSTTEAIEHLDAVRVGNSNLPWQLELCHMQAVSLFGAGKFKSAVDAAIAGKSICEKLKTLKKFDADSLCYGSHDGAACCKMFLTLGLLIGNGPSNGSTDETSATLARAVVRGYVFPNSTNSEKGLDDVTRTIIAGYDGLYDMILRDYDAAQIAVRRFGELRSHVPPRWRVFSEAMQFCADVGALWNRSTAEPLDIELITRLNCLLSEYEKSLEEYPLTDFLPLWNTYRAVAYSLLNQHERAENCFIETVKMAVQRSELYYLPETYYFQAWARRRAHPGVAIDDLWDNARKVAAGIESEYYRSRLMNPEQWV